MNTQLIMNFENFKSNLTEKWGFVPTVNILAQFLEKLRP